MKKLLMKEFRLALHPTNLIFLLLSAMLLIPNYPYYVIFFYTTLGIFFVCLTGRENRDIAYSMLLPVSKRDIVHGRVLFAVVLEMAQIAAAIPFMVLRQKIMPSGNLVGMDANLALLGLSLMMLGVFNAVFFPRYYANPSKVGIAFLWGSGAMLLFMLAAETLPHVEPLFRDVLDGMGGEYVWARWMVLLLGLAIFALLTFYGDRASCKKFEHLDL